ncbi:glycosyltransferase, partial [Pseudoxanthomonas sp. SGD-10]
KAYFKKYGLKEEQLVFAPHAIDNLRFAEDRKAEALQLRTQLGIMPEDILILFAGKLEPKKSPDILLDAFVALNKEISPGNLGEMTGENKTDFSTPLPDEKSGQASMTKRVHLLFVGNGVLESKLKAESEKLKAKIHFIDFQNQSQMPVVYQACDVFCLPSQGPGETWGLAVNEAMAAGKAILASDKVGCAVDLVKDSMNGYIFESGNQADLQEKLKCLLKADLKEMGIESQNRIQEWSFEMQVKTFITELHRIHA